MYQTTRPFAVAGRLKHITVEPENSRCVWPQYMTRLVCFGGVRSVGIPYLMNLTWMYRCLGKQIPMNIFEHFTPQGFEISNSIAYGCA
jgi:hypothetical protein